MREDGCGCTYTPHRLSIIVNLPCIESDKFEAEVKTLVGILGVVFLAFVFGKVGTILGLVPRPTKKVLTDSAKTLSIAWLGDRDSNPDKRSQSPLSCH